MNTRALGYVSYAYVGNVLMGRRTSRNILVQRLRCQMVKQKKSPERTALLVWELVLSLWSTGIHMSSTIDISLSHFMFVPDTITCQAQSHGSPVWVCFWIRENPHLVGCGLVFFFQVSLGGLPVLIPASGPCGHAPPQWITSIAGLWRFLRCSVSSPTEVGFAPLQSF